MNKLYVIAGERNINAAQINGGLFANVGQTTRTVQERLSDKDYRQKSAGGKWKILLQDIDLGEFEDAHIHEQLRERNDVIWDPTSSNTEEFHFVTDTGSGDEVKRIIAECIENLKRTHPVQLESLPRKLEKSGVKNASEFSEPGIYWFKVNSFYERIDKNNRKYLIVRFNNDKKGYQEVFCWAWEGPYPKIGAMFLASIKKGKISLMTSYGRMKLIYDGHSDLTPAEEYFKNDNIFYDEYIRQIDALNNEIKILRKVHTNQTKRLEEVEKREALLLNNLKLSESELESVRKNNLGFFSGIIAGVCLCVFFFLLMYNINNIFVSNNAFSANTIENVEEQTAEVDFQNEETKTPVYTEEDVRVINDFRLQRGLPPINIYNEEVTRVPIEENK